jgi:hypothetical protein
LIEKHLKQTFYSEGEAISTFLPKDTTPARAWTLAKVSLRSLKRDLRRKQGKKNQQTLTNNKHQRKTKPQT